MYNTFSILVLLSVASVISTAVKFSWKGSIDVSSKTSTFFVGYIIYYVQFNVYMYMWIWKALITTFRLNEFWTVKLKNVQFSSFLCKGIICRLISSKKYSITWNVLLSATFSWNTIWKIKDKSCFNITFDNLLMVFILKIMTSLF